MTAEDKILPKPLVSVRGLHKFYPAGRRFPWFRSKPPILALDGFDMDIFPGKIHALIGPNGAGKTTLLKILWNLIQPDEGLIESNHLADDDTVLVSGEERGFYYRLNGWANLVFFGRLSGNSRQETLSRATQLAERLRLSGILNRRYQTYSSGERQKLAILRALLQAPRLMMIDDLAKGLDPQATRELTDILLELARDGMSILLATHRLDLAAQMCDTITLIHRGKNIATGSPQKLSQQVFPHRHYRIVLSGDEVTARKILAGSITSDIEIKDGHLSAELVVSDEEELAKLSLTLAQNGISIIELSPLEEELETVYNRLLQDSDSNDG